MQARFFVLSKWFFGLSILFLMLTGCVGEDNTAPEIEEGTFRVLVYDERDESFSQELANGGTIEVPGSFVIAGNLRDDVLIEKMEVSIIPQDDFTESPGTRISIFPWDVSGDTVIELSVQGNAVNVFREIEIPNSARSGNYLLDMIVFDREGNASTTFSKPFSVLNENPVVSLTEPINDFANFIIDDTLRVQGTIESNTDLLLVSLRLGAGDNFRNIRYNESVFLENTFQIDTGFYVSDSIGVGTRFLRVTARDLLDKSSSLEIPVSISEF